AFTAAGHIHEPLPGFLKIHIILLNFGVLPLILHPKSPIFMVKHQSLRENAKTRCSATGFRILTARSDGE
ncbi:MAG: hypothetical protein IJ422_03920, partial [Oscillospiraceae bacterium]|nr:hypothetical protein [Oscillospiraceae bacterium]